MGCFESEGGLPDRPHLANCFSEMDLVAKSSESAHSPSATENRRPLNRFSVTRHKLLATDQTGIGTRKCLITGLYGIGSVEKVSLQGLTGNDNNIAAKAPKGA